MSTTPMHRRLVRHLLLRGASITVHDSQVRRSMDKKAILDEVEACDESQITVHLDGKEEWALIIQGLDPEETLADFSSNGVIDAWFEEQPS